MSDAREVSPVSKTGSTAQMRSVISAPLLSPAQDGIVVFTSNASPSKNNT